MQHRAFPAAPGRRHSARMSWRIPLLVAFLVLFAPGHPAAAQAPAPSPATPAWRPYAEWAAACRALPSNRSLRGNVVPGGFLPLARFGDFTPVLDAFVAQCRTGALAQAALWVGEPPKASEFLNPDGAHFLAPGAPASALLRPFLAGRSPGGPSTAIPFQPFVQKAVLPEDAEVYVHADLHGDIRSLVADLDWLNAKGYLDGFDIARPGFHMVFLGDYTDRGSHGIEVLYTLLRLRVANPGRVFLCRGNHEEGAIAARYGFLSEGRLKYGAAFDAARVLRAYDFLPVAVWLGVAGNHLQCHHGGMEPGFDPRPLLAAPGPVAFQFLGTLAQRGHLRANPGMFGPADGAPRALFERAAQDFRPVDPINPVTLGYMWNDFTLASDEPGFAVDPGRAFVYGQSATRHLLEQARAGTNAVHAVFRGHQQSSAPNPMMRRLLAGRGVFRHWQAGDSTARFGDTVAQLEKVLEGGAERAVPAGSVWTFNISPDSLYGEANGFDYDAFGLLRTTRNPADWRLRVVNVDVAR